MKKFRFRFEKILAHRKYIEKQKQIDLAAAIDMEMKQRKKLQDIDSDRRFHETAEKKFLTGKINPDKLKGFTRYYLLLKRMEMSGYEILGKLSREVENRREELVKASVQKKIYARLKERHKFRYDREVNLYLQKENDEIASRRR